MTQQQRTMTKPVPIPTPDTDFYWEKCQQHELWVRKCNHCTRAYFYPRNICPNCFSRNTDWVQCSGKATLHAFGIVVRPPHRGWVEDVPFVVAIVDLEEGCRMPTNLVQIAINLDNPGEHIKVGMPVEVAWEDRTEKISLPMFKPA
ncbi:MAG: OB-fold domain-containing protein [Dehalococcoidia bacterium]|nr:OB-fold domain-containing protein [Dehalococcoidia bacterium]